MTCAALNGSSCSPLIGPAKNVVALWDRPNTIVNLAEDVHNKQERAELLNKLCLSNNAVALQLTCDYSKMTETPTQTPRHMPTKYSPVTADNVKTKVTAEWTDTVTTVANYGVTLDTGPALKLFKIITAGVTATYKKTVTEEHTFKQSVQITLDPGDKGFICVAQPLLHYDGTLTVRTPNTTWILPGVVVDTPNPDIGGDILTFKEKKDVVVPRDACEKRKLSPPG
jgi:hypothetical protein